MYWRAHVRMLDQQNFRSELKGKDRETCRRQPLSPNITTLVILDKFSYEHVTVISHTAYQAVVCWVAHGILVSCDDFGAG